jgi:biotin synthase
VRKCNNATMRLAARPRTSDMTPDWTPERIEALLELPLPELMWQAQQVHRANFDPTEVQLSSLLSIKTGGCAEDCGYCPQSAHHEGGVAADKLMDADLVVANAQAARDAGASRFCMGAAWREPKDRDIDKVAHIVERVKAMGLETCMTLGMLKPAQAQRLAAAGLDYYNHNLDTSPEFYGEIISTRTYQDRLDTLDAVRDAGMNVCCGGIVGMGESRRDRASLLAQLANLDPYPESVPINALVRVAGTPLEHAPDLDPFEFVRSVAAARICMPRAWVRLSAGRRELGDGVQALCFLAGANSIFYGDTLLVTGNADVDADRALFARLGLHAQGQAAAPVAPSAAPRPTIRLQAADA